MSKNTISQPFLAIWMVTYNHEKYIEKAVESVMAQITNFDYKLFIGEDCSADKTRESCLNLKQKYPDKIELVLQDVNIGGNLNADIIYKKCFASGAKYIAMLEGDDYWTDENKLQKQIYFLEANLDFNICFHAFKIDKDNVLSSSVLNDQQKEVTTIDDLQHKNYIQTCTVVFRNNISKLPEWFKNSVPADYALFMLAVGKTAKIKFLNEEMANYRVHPGGMWSMQNNSKKILSYTATLYNILNEFGLDKKNFSKHILCLIADNIYLYGFKYISLSKCLFYLRKLYFHGDFSFKQKMFMLTCYIRHLLNLIIGKHNDQNFK